MTPVPQGYDALRNSAAWLDVSARGKIKATGEDRARLFHAMTTNHIERLTPGSGCYAFFLSAQGRILADVNLLCRPDHFLLDTEPETREKIFKHLDSFIIADDVTLEDVTSSLLSIAIEGPAASAVLTRIGAPTPEQDYENAEWGNRLVARMTLTGGPGFQVMAPVEEREELLGRLRDAGVTQAEPDAFRIVRIENGRPRYGDDISERYLAQETNQARALNFQKGCYLGQEIVERVRSRGQIHRILMPLVIDATEPPAAGTKLHVGESNAGEVTSAVFSPSLEKVAALAYVRVEHSRPGDRLSIENTSATVRGGDKEHGE